MNKIIIHLIVLLILLSLLSGCDQSVLFSQQLPEIISVTPDKYICLPGESISIHVNAVDSEGDPISISWISTSGTLALLSGQTNTWTAPSKVGNAEIWIYVSDQFHDKEVKYELSLEVRSEVLGTNVNLISGDGGITMPGNHQTIPYGSPVNIFALPDEGYLFAGWSIESGNFITISDPGKAFTTITLTQGSATIKANFAPETYSLVIRNDGKGTTSVSNIDSVTYNTPVSLTATPISNYVFHSWTVEEGSGVIFADYTAASTTVTLTKGAAVIKANFVEEASQAVQRDFFSYNYTGSHQPGTLHIKTNIPRGSNVMYRILAEGYNYGNSRVINSDICGYTYSISSTIIGETTTNYATGATLTQYYSRDGYVTIALASADTYYIGFALSAWFTNPNGFAFDIEVLQVSMAAL